MKITELLRTTSLLKLIISLSAVAVIFIAITVSVLYKLALTHEGRLLAESLSNQVMLMQTMQQLVDNEPVKDENHEGNLIFNAITHMQKINQQAIASGHSSEYVVAERQADQIVFLLTGKHSDIDHNYKNNSGHEHQPGHRHTSIPFNSSKAEPMRRALSGETGTIVGLDHHGKKVLAAYQYMSTYKLGIVAKIDIDELLTPYLLIILFTSCVAIILVFIGAYAFVTSVRPFYVKRERSAGQLRKQHEIMSGLTERKNIDPCDMQMIFEEITEAACAGLGIARASIWMYNDDRSTIHCADTYDAITGLHDDLDDISTVKHPSYFSALAKGTVVVNHAISNPATCELADDHLIPNNIQALLDLPIWVDGEDIGILCNEHNNIDHEWSLEDQNFARSIAEHIAMTLANCQRNKAEQHLKESEQRYQLAVSGSNDGLWDWDISTNKVYRSPQYIRLLGYDDNELNIDRNTWLAHLHPEDKHHAIDALNAHIKNADTPYDIEYRLRTKSGVYRWFRCRGSALRDENGTAIRVSGSITDITDLKRIQSNLSRFKQTLDEISENIFMFDPDTLQFFYVNKSAIDNSGYSEAELLQMTPVDLNPEFSEKTFREMSSILISKPEETLNFETVHQSKDGIQGPVEINLQYISPTDSSPRFVAIVRDIAERRNSEIENYVQRTMLEHIYKVQDEFISGEDRQNVFEQLLNGILDITESEFGLIGEVLYPTGESPYVRTRYISDIAWNDEIQKHYDKNSSEGLEFRELNSLIGAIITSGNTVIANDPDNDPRSGGLPEGHPPLESYMGIPLKIGKSLTGMVGIANRTGGYDEAVLKQLQPLLSTCANLLEAEKTELLRNSMENALRMSEEKANSVLATVADGIITIDGSGAIESFNHAAEKIFGYTSDEVFGKNVNILMPEPYHSAHDTYLENYHQTGKARIMGQGREVVGKRKDGTVFPMDLSVSEVHSGTSHRYTGVARDISERKQVEIAMIAARDEAEQANRTKSEFLSSMSHELRTPLNAIMGFAQLLQFDTELSDSHKKHAQEIYGAGNLLLDLINDVLDLAKIEAGHIDLSIDSVKVTHILDECFKLIQPQANKSGIKLGYEHNKSRHNCCNDVWVRADNTRIKQVLLNLLSNAIKYNRKNGAVDICCPPAAEGYRRICITDSGRGINEKDIESLFQPFNRLGAERSDIEGTGIGLVITRKLVELMGGTISVESELGKGTSFLVDLPVSEAVIPIKRSTSNQLEKPDTTGIKKHRILIAEDNLTNQELITLQLHTLGYKSDVVTNGKEAFDLLHRQQYDLLLTDIHMPEMDGYQLTRAIRDSENSNVKSIIIVAITANAAADEATRCLEKGMNDYLSKPVDINQLQKKLGQWLPGSKDSAKERINETLYGRQVTETPTTATSLAIDPDTLTRYVGSDPDKHKHFFMLFLDTAPETILDIHKAYKDRSLKNIKDNCHKLKSSARAIGAIRLATICQYLETASVNEDWNAIDETMSEINTAMSDVDAYIHDKLNEKKQEQVKFSFNDVLIVDDDRFVLDLVTSRLNNIGISNVTTASSGEEALVIINDASIPPSVLLLDLNMPGMDGVEFLRHLAEHSYQGNIILISGEDTRLLRSAESIARDRSLNILGALEKPVTIPHLTELLIMVGAERKTRPMYDKISLTNDDLINGLKNDEFVIYYQPQVDIASKKLSGVEALVRWIHPERGMIPPDAFIPVAEELNLINEMTDIILRKAMHQCVEWREHGLDINLSVNISVDSLDRLDLPEYIVNCAHEHKLEVSKIMLEITESRLMQDITSALDILTRLSLKGIKLSIDDFGTGYSSMEQLQRIPFTELKIDRSFVNGALHNKAARAILESSVELAQKLNMTIVAEGVENNEDLTLITGLGCTYAQGYFIGRPMPGDELIQWHDEWVSNNKPV